MEQIIVNGKKDPVTGFLAKEELTPFLVKLKIHSDTSNKPFSVMLIELDHFRRSSSRWDAADDQVINYFASALRVACPFKQDFIVFCGDNDRYIAIFKDAGSARAYNAGKVLERRIRCLPFVLNKWKIKLNFSAGIAAYPQDDRDADKLLAKAEYALNNAKKLGGGRVCQFSQSWHESFKRYLVPIPFVLVALILVVFLSYTPAKKQHPRKKGDASIFLKK